MSKRLIVETLFKRMNIKLNVEVETITGTPILLIGGLTPKWKIYNTPNKRGFTLVRVKWFGNSFKDLKPQHYDNFRTCVAFIVLGEMNAEYAEITRDVIDGNIVRKKRKLKEYVSRK